MYIWEKNKIRFMRDASEYGNYYETIGDWLKTFILPDDVVCDAGCGLGYLSLQLAKYSKTVTAVDTHEDALGVLKENIERLGIFNIEVVQRDVCNFIPNRRFDKLVCCFFGNPEEILCLRENICNGDVFVILRNDDKHELSYNELCRYLKFRDIPYEGKTMEIEFGQPFRNRMEAQRFIRLYHYGEVEKNYLTDIANETFPLYLPKRKKIGMIRITSNN